MQLNFKIYCELAIPQYTHTLETFGLIIEIFRC